MSIGIFSQLNKKWKNILLGFSTTRTLGSDGCTITCLACVLNITPAEVNTRLKAVGGFSGALVIWAKIKEAFPELAWEFRGYNYDEGQVKAAIAKNNFCLVEVDFDGTERDDDRHWILALPGNKAIDPWTGTVISFEKYKIKRGYSIINIKGESVMSNIYKGLDLSNPESMKVVVDTWDEVVNQKLYIKKADAHKDCVSKVDYEIVKEQLKAANDLLKEKEEKSDIVLDGLELNGISTEEVIDGMKYIRNYKVKEV